MAEGLTLPLWMAVVRFPGRAATFALAAQMISATGRARGKIHKDVKFIKNPCHVQLPGRR
jgi:hypothetical protein